MAGLSDHCGRCDQEVAYALPRCPICHKAICDECAVRMGGASFCGADCAHAFFFGGDEEVDESRVSESEDGE